MGNHAIELVNSLGDHWASWMGAAVIDSICLLPAVSAIWWLIRRRVAPNVGYALFLLVPLRLLSPIAIGVPHGIANWLPSQIAVRWLEGAPKAPPARAKAETEHPAAETVLPLVDSSALQMHGDFRPSREPQSSVPGARAPVAITPAPIAIVPRPAIHWTLIAMAIWLVVVVLLATRFIFTQFELRRWLRRAKEIDDLRLREILQSLCQQAAIRRRVRLVESDRVASPAAWGLIRPTIIVPSGFCASLGEKQLRWMLLHELAHLKRHDLPVIFLQRIAAIANFFNPAVWIANRAANRLREYACDDFATLLGASSGVEASEAFIKTLQHAYRTQQKLQGALGIFGLDPRGACFARMRRMLDPDRPMRKRAGWQSIAALAIIALAALPHLYAAPGSAPPPAAVEKSPQTAAAKQSNETKLGSGLPKIRNPDKTIPFSLSGHVRGPDGKALAGIEVHLVTTYAYAAMPLVQVRSFIAKSGTDGSFKFSDVPISITKGGVERNSPNVGGFMLWSAPPRYGFVWSGLRNYWDTDDNSGANEGPGIVHKRQGGVDFYRDKPVVVDLDFVPATTLRGRVVDEDNKPIAGADVSLWDADYLDGSGKALHINYRQFAGMQQLMKRELRSARTDGDGRFSIGGLQPEICFGVRIKHKGFADSSFYAATTNRPITGHQFSDTAAAVERGGEWVELSQPGSHPTRPNGFTAILQRPHRVLIDVVAADTGEPLANVAVYNAWQDQGPMDSSKSDLQGRAVLNLPRGEYTLAADPPKKSLYVSTEAELDGTAGRDREPFRFALTRGCEATFEAVDAATGKGIPGVSFHVLDLMPPFKPIVVGSGDKPSFLQQSMHRPLDWRKTDAAGRLQVVLPPGTFSFEACGLNYDAADSTAPATLPSGGNATVQFKLTPTKATATEPKQELASGDQSADAGENGAAAKADRKGTSNERQVFTLRVVGPDKKPLPGITVTCRANPALKPEDFLIGKIARRTEFVAFVKLDKHGRLQLRLPKNPMSLDIDIETPGFGPYWAEWNSRNHPELIPSEFVAELDAAWSVGGVVVDEDGKPIEGVSVNPSMEMKKRPGDMEQMAWVGEAKTNAKGEWHYDSVPISKKDVNVQFDHPKFTPARWPLARSDYEVKPGAEPTAKIPLTAGIMVTGTVTDEQGRPIAGAHVRAQRDFPNTRDVTTDANGKYDLHGFQIFHTGLLNVQVFPGQIFVTAKGRAPDFRDLTPLSLLAPVNFRLKPGGTIRIKVLDPQGNPVPHAQIFFQQWRGPFNELEFGDNRHYADEHGVWASHEAPLDKMEADICGNGHFMDLAYQPLVAREKEYVFHLLPLLVVSGHVVDAETKKPIAAFRVNQAVVSNGSKPTWWPNDTFNGANGHFQLCRDRQYDGFVFKIEADGYKPAISRTLKSDEGNVSLDFELQKR